MCLVDSIFSVTDVMSTAFSKVVEPYRLGAKSQQIHLCCTKYENKPWFSSKDTPKLDATLRSAINFSVLINLALPTLRSSEAADVQDRHEPRNSGLPASNHRPKSKTPSGLEVLLRQGDFFS